MKPLPLGPIFNWVQKAVKHFKETKKKKRFDKKSHSSSRTNENVLPHKPKVAGKNQLTEGHKNDQAQRSREKRLPKNNKTKQRFHANAARKLQILYRLTKKKAMRQVLNQQCNKCPVPITETEKFFEKVMENQTLKLITGTI